MFHCSILEHIISFLIQMSLSVRIDFTIDQVFNQIERCKKELHILKNEINQTLSEIRALDKILKQNKICPICRQFFNDLSAAHVCHVQNENYVFSCKYCGSTFEQPWKLLQHQRRYHYSCFLCKQKYDEFETIQNHEQFTCPQVKVSCSSCKTLISRKILDQHIKKCFFRQCNKCFKNIYFKAFSYHLKICQAETCPNPRNRFEQNNISCLPCSCIA